MGKVGNKLVAGEAVNAGGMVLHAEGRRRQLGKQGASAVPALQVVLPARVRAVTVMRLDPRRGVELSRRLLQREPAVDVTALLKRCTKRGN